MSGIFVHIVLYNYNRRLAVEQTLQQRAVFQQFKRALEHDNADMLPHKKAEDARTIFPLPVNVCCACAVVLSQN